MVQLPYVNVYWRGIFFLIYNIICVYIYIIYDRMLDMYVLPEKARVEPVKWTCFHVF